MITEGPQSDTPVPTLPGLNGDTSDPGPAATYNACVMLCDQHVGKHANALRWLATDGRAQMLSFETLQSRAARFADLLVSVGVKPGDRVAGLLPRTPELLTVLLGTLRAGAVYQPVFTAFGPKAIEVRLEVSEPKVVVTDSANRSKLEGMGYPVMITDDASGSESLSRVLKTCSTRFAPVMLPASAPFLMMFTSGTTGTPKGLLVPLSMLRAVASYMRYGLDLRDADNFWNLADPGWAYGLYYGVIGPLLMGITATLSEAAFSVERSYEVIRRFSITNLTGAPTAYRQMAASPLPPPTGVRVISSAGETLDVETAAWLSDTFGCPARDHFGQTELGMVLCDHHGFDHPRRPGSVGYPLPGFQVTTISSIGVKCARGERGPLAVDRRSPLFWFAGYYRRSEQPFLGDYYFTGDNAVHEEDGSFSFAGREDDVITSSGYRIGPFEVESALMEHPAVLEAAVVGKPDPIRTEVVKAYVVLKPGSIPCAALGAEIGQFVKQRLAAHAYPREISFVVDLPKTLSGKIQRFILRQQESAEETAPR